jgi:hypothetical protein
LCKRGASQDGSDRRFLRSKSQGKFTAFLDQSDAGNMTSLDTFVVDRRRSDIFVRCYGCREEGVIPTGSGGVLVLTSPSRFALAVVHRRWLETCDVPSTAPSEAQRLSRLVFLCLFCMTMWRKATTPSVLTWTSHSPGVARPQSVQDRQATTYNGGRNMLMGVAAQLLNRPESMWSLLI